MAKNHKTSIAKLEKGIVSLRDGLKSLNEGDDWEEFLKILHRPGWTTPAELTFTLGIVESLTTQIESVANLKAAFIKGSGQVGGGI